MDSTWEVINQYMSQLRVVLLDTNYATTPLTWGAPPALLQYSKLYYIEDGEGFISINDQKLYPKKGDFLYIPEGCTHSFSVISSKPFTKYWCHFTAHVGTMPLSSLLRIPVVIEVGENNQIKALFLKILESHNIREPLAPLLCHSALLELIQLYLRHVNLLQLSTEVNDTTSNLNRLLRYMDEHIMEKITLTTLAAIVNIHPNYLVKIFKNQFGMTPIEYLNLMRINTAKELLKLRTKRISEIATEVGYSNQYYFSQVFKKQTGLTPSEYRDIN